MVERIDIERALDQAISDETGMRFQSLAVVLAKLRWPELIASERHKDRGLDAYASPMVSPDGRGKGLASSTTADVSKISSDAKKAKEHYEGLTLLVFATPAKVSREKEEAWRNEIRERHDLELIVISREDIITTLQVPENAVLCKAHLKIPVVERPGLGDISERVRAAVAETISFEVQRLANRPRINLTAAVRSDAGRLSNDRFSAAELLSSLFQGRRVVIEAPAGRGKTTTLVLIAEAAADEGVPIIVDLPAFVRAGKDVLAFLTEHPAYRARGIDAQQLARLSSERPLIFLMNGWNEITEASTADALVGLSSVERSFPAAGILVVTRAHHVQPPLPGAMTVELLPVSSGQRARYVTEALPANARELLTLIANDRALEAVTCTPLFLSEVTRLFEAGREIPRTTVGVLGAVVRMQEEAEHHRAALAMEPLRGRAEFYLRRIAMAMTAKNAVTLADDEARSVCSEAGDALRERRQLATTPEPGSILASLTAHHLLERLQFPGVSYRFAHQQFQEYYAALTLRDIAAAPTTHGTKEGLSAFAQSYLNIPLWEEPLVLLAGSLGSTDEDIAIGKVLVEGALAIDPPFAARLAHAAGAPVWSATREAVHARLRTLLASSSLSDQQLAFAAMLSTGSDEFADVLVPRLTSENANIRHAIYRSGGVLSRAAVGSDWQSVVRAWTEEQQIEFLWHLALDSRDVEAAHDFATAVDESPGVQIEALRILLWVRRYDAVLPLLRQLTDDLFMQAIERVAEHELPEDLQERSRRLVAAQFTSTGDPVAQFQLALRLLDEKDPNAAGRMQQALSRLTSEQVRDLDRGPLHRAIDALRAMDEAWVSAWVARQVAEGTLWFERWQSMVTIVSAGLRDELFSSLRNPSNLNGDGAVGVLAVSAEGTFVARVFDQLRAQQYDDPSDETAYRIKRRLENLLCSFSWADLVFGLRTLLEREPFDEDLDILLALFDRHRADEKAGEMTPSDRAQLRTYMKAAVPLVLARDDFRGEAKAQLSSALAQLGEPGDATDVRRLLDADIERVLVGRAERSERHRSPRAEGAMMRQAPAHVQALVRIDRFGAETRLLELLREPEYELDAAWALREVARIVPSERHTIDGRFGERRRDYRELRGAKGEWERLFDGDRRVRYASAIRARVEDLLAASGRGGEQARGLLWRAKELTRPLAALDPHDSAELLLRVGSAPLDFDAEATIGSLEALVFAGVQIDAERVFTMVDRLLERLRTRGRYNDNSGMFERVGSLLPFVDPPERGLSRLQLLLEEFQLAAHELRRILPALGECDHPAALLLLVDLARQSGTNFEHIARDWFAAIVTSPLQDAREILLRLLRAENQDPVAQITISGDARYFFVEALVRLASNDPAFADLVFACCVNPPSPDVRLVLASVCERVGTPQAVSAALLLVRDDEDPAIPFEVRSALEGLFLEKLRDGGVQNAFTLVPRAAAEVRAQLVEMTRSDPMRSRSASELLAQIDLWRLEHGRPPTEPRRLF